MIFFIKLVLRIDNAANFVMIICLEKKGMILLKINAI